MKNTRNKIIEIRVTEDEYRQIKQAATSDKDKINISAYCRKKILGYAKNSNEDVIKNVKELRYEIRKIGVNFNQITKKINAGFGGDIDYSNAERILFDINERLETYIKIFESSFVKEDESQE